MTKKYMLGFLVLAFATLSAGLVYAQGVTGVGNLITNDPISQYLDKGGIAIMMAVLLYFYRTVLESAKSQSEVLLKIVEASTKAQTEFAIALNASTQAVANSVSAINLNTAATQQLSTQFKAKIT